MKGSPSPRFSSSPDSGDAGAVHHVTEVSGARTESSRRASVVLAGLAAAVGAGYATVSAYWALGGQDLLSTLGQPFERWGHARDASAAIALWAVVALKLAAAGLPAVAISLAPRQGWPRWVRRLAWAAAVTLLIYGTVVSAG